MSQPLYQKEIIFDRELGDYALYLDGQLQGFARSYVEGEIALDGLIAAELSASQSIDERLRELSDQYQDAKAAGSHVLAATIKQAARELAAQKMGMTVAEFVAGYADYQAEQAEQAAPAPVPTAYVCIDAWYGRDEKPVEIIKETPKRYLVRTLAESTLLPGGRREPAGTEVYVPKTAIKFAA